MSNLSRRSKANFASKPDENNNYDSYNNESDDMELLPTVPSGECISQDTGNISFLESMFKNFSPKWKNGFVRGLYGALMIIGFSFIVSLGM